MSYASRVPIFSFKVGTQKKLVFVSSLILSVNESRVFVLLTLFFTLFFLGGGGGVGGSIDYDFGQFWFIDTYIGAQHMIFRFEFSLPGLCRALVCFIVLHTNCA